MGAVIRRPKHDVLTASEYILDHMRKVRERVVDRSNKGCGLFSVETVAPR
jgi:hypothetical protein